MITPFLTYHILMLHLALGGAAVAVLAFGSLAPWYKSWTGVVLFTTKVNLLLLILMIMSNVWFGPAYQGISLVRSVIYTLLAVTNISLALIIIHVQFNVRKRKRNWTPISITTSDSEGEEIEKTKEART